MASFSRASLYIQHSYRLLFLLFEHSLVLGRKTWLKMESDAIHNTVVRSLNATKWVPPLQKIGVIARIDIVHSRHTFLEKELLGCSREEQWVWRECTPRH